MHRFILIKDLKVNKCTCSECQVLSSISGSTSSPPELCQRIPASSDSCLSCSSLTHSLQSSLSLCSCHTDFVSSTHTRKSPLGTAPAVPVLGCSATHAHLPDLFLPVWSLLKGHPFYKAYLPFHVN